MMAARMWLEARRDLVHMGSLTDSRFKLASGVWTLMRTLVWPGRALSRPPSSCICYGYASNDEEWQVRIYDASSGLTVAESALATNTAPAEIALTVTPANVSDARAIWELHGRHADKGGLKAWLYWLEIMY